MVQTSSGAAAATNVSLPFLSLSQPALSPSLPPPISLSRAPTSLSSLLSSPTPGAASSKPRLRPTPCDPVLQPPARRATLPDRDPSSRAAPARCRDPRPRQEPTRSPDAPSAATPPDAHTAPRPAHCAPATTSTRRAARAHPSCPRPCPAATPRSPCAHHPIEFLHRAEPCQRPSIVTASEQPKDRSPTSISLDFNGAIFPPLIPLSMNAVNGVYAGRFFPLPASPPGALSSPSIPLAPIKKQTSSLFLPCTALTPQLSRETIHPSSPATTTATLSNFPCPRAWSHHHRRRLLVRDSAPRTLLPAIVACLCCLPPCCATPRRSLLIILLFMPCCVRCRQREIQLEPHRRCVVVEPSPYPFSSVDRAVPLLLLQA
jgi:hypothetical protein